MTTRIDRRFAALKKEGRAALVTFVTAGDPNYDTSLKIVKGLPRAGADVIEFGMPFTDPMADGPAIQAAGLRALHVIYKLFTPAGEIKAWQPGGDVYKTPYFKIYCPSPQVYGVLNITGFLHNIPFYTDLQTALDSFE